MAWRTCSDAFVAASFQTMLSNLQPIWVTSYVVSVAMAAPLKQFMTLATTVIEIFPFAVADTTFDFGVIGDNVGGGPTVYDIRADARFRPDVLAQHIDGVQGQHGPIQGIAAVPGFTGGVSRLAVEGVR